jgi:hypothetical protein
MLEEAAMNDPVQLQQGFEAYDECGSKSMKVANIF